MKRVPPAADAPPPRRRRGLSREELALWESVAKSIKPLRRTPRAPKAVIEAEAAPVVEKTRAKVKPEKHPPALVAPKVAKAPPSPPPLAPLGRRERAKLSRGRSEIEARLDLHGMTQARAHRTLMNFLRGASEDGLTFVLVITGKGRSGAADTERGVLRRQVPEWLALPEFRSLVVGFEEAHIGHGGAGALYVRVRRGR
jgi:DNA-nicking Smr family endonuclease